MPRKKDITSTSNTTQAPSQAQTQAQEYIALEIKDVDPLYKYSHQISRHPSRERVYNKFFTLLQLHSSLDINKLQAIALNIEKSIFNYTLLSTKSNDWNILFQNIYIGYCVKVYSNLNPDSIVKNTNLIKRLFNNEFNEYDIINFTPEEIFPERYNEIVEFIAANRPKEAPKLKLEDMPDGAFRCNKCKSWKTEYIEVQTRSAKYIGWKSTLLITSWLCYWENSCSPSYFILKC
jgi:hypothetical protein